MRVVFARDYTANWLALSAPSLLIHGTNDSMIPVANSREFAKLLKSSKLAEINGANHVLVLNNVKEVATEIKKFV